MSRTAQFEGRTAEEAVARARAALGDSGALRCWKTRRGGVGGFFAKEVFVAGLTPPPGSETTRGRASRAMPGPLGTGSDHAAAHAAPKAGVESASASVPQEAQDTSARPEDHLFQLVEGTSDQVSLGSLAIPAEAFDEVLAEAQAALTREREGRGIAIPPSSPSPEAQGVATEEPSVSEHDLALPEDGQPGGTPAAGETSTASREPTSSGPGTRPASPRPAKKATRPKPKAGRTPAAAHSAAATRGQGSRSTRIPELRAGLRSLGVPDPYVPRGQRPSLDQLVGVMGTLPEPPPLPNRSGAVVVVMGSERELDRTVDLVRAELSLGQRDILRFAGSSGAPMGPTAVTSTEGQRLGRQIARRRACGRTSLLALPASPGMSLGRESHELLDQTTPDYVLVAVGASSKRVDVEHLIGELLRVDAVALWDLSRTRTPAELLGVLPIAFVEGKPSSSLGWTLTLAGRVMDGGGR